MPSIPIDEIIIIENSQMSESGSIVLALLRELKYIAEHRILMSAGKEMAKQKVLHRMWINNDNTMREIERKREEIETEESKFNAIIAEKGEEIQLLERSREILLAKNSTELNEKMYGAAPVYGTQLKC